MTEAMRAAVRAICPHAKWGGCLTDTCKYQERGNECFRDAEIAKNIIEALEPHFAAREAAAVASAVLAERRECAALVARAPKVEGKFGWRDETQLGLAALIRARSTQESGR